VGVTALALKLIWLLEGIEAAPRLHVANDAVSQLRLTALPPEPHLVLLALVVET
jgi:hypothetical protein